MSFPIHDRGQRSRLELRAKPYFVRLTDGVHVGYRKGKGVSRWVIRRYDGNTYRMQTMPGIRPDDEQPADGLRILNFQQMVKKVMSENTKMPLKCSFCGKSAKQVEKLIAGPSVFICNECVALCQLYIDHPENTKGKLLLDEDLKPVLRNGQPVFVPVTEEESQVFRDRYDLA